MYGLYLNHVTQKAEQYHFVCVSDDKQKLLNYLEEWKLDNPTLIDGYYRSFRSDSDLYWYNKPTMHGVNTYGAREGVVQIATLEEHLENATENYYAYINSVRRV